MVWAVLMDRRVWVRSVQRSGLWKKVFAAVWSIIGVTSSETGLRPSEVIVYTLERESLGGVVKVERA
jgi:hypothetical protein